MPCTICRVQGCRADVCLSDIIHQSHEKLNRVLIDTVYDVVDDLTQWPAYRVSHINYPYSSLIYQGEPNEIRERICFMRENYLNQDIQTRIKKKLRDVVYNWNIGLFKRVIPLLQITTLDQYNRLLVDPRLVSPKTVTDYKSYMFGLAMFHVRAHLPTNFLDLTDVPDADLIPERVIYRTRVVYKEVRVQSKITMEMCGPDEKYLTDDTCPICMEETKINNVVAYTCGHAFCCGCSFETLKRCGRKCPMCRVKTTCIKFKADILPNNFNTLMELVR